MRRYNQTRTISEIIRLRKKNQKSLKRPILRRVNLRRLDLSRRTKRKIIDQLKINVKNLPSKAL